MWPFSSAGQLKFLHGHSHPRTIQDEIVSSSSQNCHIPSGTSLYSLWEGGAYRGRYRETRFVEGHFVDQLTQKGGENTPEKDDLLQRSSARPDRRAPRGR